MKPIIGISIGDINGVGPEILLQTLSDNRILDLLTPVIFGSSKVLAFYKKILPENTGNFFRQLCRYISPDSLPFDLR